MSTHVAQFIAGLKGVKFIGLNARSVRGKLPEIKLNFSNTDFVCICESWLDEIDDEVDTSWFGKVAFRLDRYTRRGGGVITYVDNKYNGHCRVLTDACRMEDDIELMTIHVTKPNYKNLYIMNTYKAPVGTLPIRSSY